jgi:chromosome segregation ATPase
MYSRLVSVYLCFALAIAAHAADPAFDAEVRRLQTFLGILNQELGTQYERIKALQEAIAQSAQAGSNPSASPDIARYEDVADQRRRALAREGALRQQLDATLERIKELEVEKAPLLERVKELIAQSAEAAKSSGQSTAPAQ